MIWRGMKLKGIKMKDKEVCRDMAELFENLEKEEEKALSGLREAFDDLKDSMEKVITVCEQKQW